MGFNEFISKLFGNKASRDMKEIQPWVEKVKAVYPEISKLTNDELRAKTEELKKFIKDSAAEENKKIEELKATIESTDLENVRLFSLKLISWRKKSWKNMRKHLVKCYRLLFLL